MTSPGGAYCHTSRSTGLQVGGCGPVQHQNRSSKQKTMLHQWLPLLSPNFSVQVCAVSQQFCCNATVPGVQPAINVTSNGTTVVNVPPGWLGSWQSRYTTPGPPGAGARSTTLVTDTGSPTAGGPSPSPAGEDGSTRSSSPVLGGIGE
jgi:hypothetical protein